MKKALIGLLQISIRHPKWVLACVALSAALAAAGIPRLELRLDARSLIPAHHPALAANDQALEIFPQPDSVAIAMVAKTGSIYTPEGLGLLARLSRELAARSEVVESSVISLATLPRIWVESDRVDLDPLLDQPTLDEGMARKVREEVKNLGLDSGLLVAEDGRAAAIYARIRVGSDSQALYRDLTDWLKPLKSAGFELHLTGSVLAQAELGAASAKDLARLVPLVLVIIFGVLYYLLGSWRLAAIAILEASISLVWTAGMMGWSRQPIFVTTLVLPAILIVIGVSDDIYALHRFLLSQDKGPAGVTKAFSEVVGPILMTSATTVLALLSLALVGLEPQRILGIFGSLAVLLSTLLTLTLVPAMTVLFDSRGHSTPPRRWPLSALASFLGRTSSWRPRKAAILAVGAAASLLAILASRLVIDDSWISNLPPGNPVVLGDRVMNDHLAGTHTLELLVKPRCSAGITAPDCFAALGRLEGFLEKYPSVGGVEGPFSQVTRILAALEGRPFRTFTGQLGEARWLDAGQIEQALLLADSVRSPAARRLDEAGRIGHVTLFVRDASYQSVDHLLAEIREWASTAPLEITPFGDALVGHQTIAILVGGQISSIGLAIGMELLLLTLLFRSWTMALWALAPVLGSVLLVFAALGVFGIQLGVASSMFAALALGIGVDFSTHLVTRCRALVSRGRSWRSASRHAVRSVGPAIAISTIALSLGFSVLLGSEILPNRNLGALVSLSLLVCGTMTLLVLPPMLRMGSANSPRAGAGQPKLAGPLAACSMGVILMLLFSPSSMAEAADEVPTPQLLIERYNRRDTGASGARRVRLELSQHGQTTRVLKILQLWRQDTDEARSVFYLMEPAALAGTAYLLIEDLTQGTMSVQLFLPAGSRKVLTIMPSRFHEGLLGSDLTYRDMTWFLHTGGGALVVGTESRQVGNLSSWPLDVKATSPTEPWLRHFLRKEPPYYLGADYYSEVAADGRPMRQPQKRLRVEGWEQREGVWTPTRIVMSAPEGRQSAMFLEAARFHLNELEPGLFEPSALPELGQALRSGKLGHSLRALLE